MTMTCQEVFDKVAKHLLMQGEQAIGTHTTGGSKTTCCMYRTPDGMKCAVGCLIKNQYYTPEIEGLGVSASLEDARFSGKPYDSLVKALFRSNVIDNNDLKERTTKCTLLIGLQNIHDLSDYSWEAQPRTHIERWKSRLRELASSYHLNDSILDIV